MSENCIFCGIVAGTIPSTQVASDDRAIAFMDINPATRGHALVVPRTHTSDLIEIYTDPSATTRLAGATGPADVVTAPGSVTYQISGVPPGQYFFRCDIHPTAMTGTFKVTG